MRRRKIITEPSRPQPKRQPQSQLLNDLSYKKHTLIRQFDRKDIEEQMYLKEIGEVQRQIDDEIRVVIEKQKKDIKIKEEAITSMEENTMSEENSKKNGEEKKPGRQPKKDSYTMLIVKALQQKNIKTVEEAADKVDEWKPGRDKKKIITQMKTIIYLIKKQKVARWQKYDWNDENFLLTEK